MALEELERLARRVEEREGIRVYIVEPGVLRDAALALLDAGYDMLLSLSGVDEPKRSRIRLVYHFARSSSPGDVVALETAVSYERPMAPSIHDIYPAAQLQEREEHEMLGVVFEDNPDLRHLLLPEDWPHGVHPLRKSFRVAEEPFTSPTPSKPLEELKKKLGEEAG